MNFLGHLYFSQDHQELMHANLFGDFVKGKHFDHLLARNWDEFHQVKLTDYLADFYATKPLNWEEYPENFQLFIGKLKAHQWMNHYPNFEGLAKANPFLALCFTVSLLSLAGIPLTAGYWGKFFVFSDDLDFVRSSGMCPEGSVFVDCVEAWHDYDALRLMSLCRHFIIANSSFSWWGAWLAENPSKIVIRPDPWFANMPENDTRDLCPEGWVALKR
jgi:hypothetical protein